MYGRCRKGSRFYGVPKKMLRSRRFKKGSRGMKETGAIDLPLIFVPDV